MGKSREACREEEESDTVAAMGSNRSPREKGVRDGWRDRESPRCSDAAPSARQWDAPRPGPGVGPMHPPRLATVGRHTSDDYSKERKARNQGFSPLKWAGIVVVFVLSLLWLHEQFVLKGRMNAIEEVRASTC